MRSATSPMTSANSAPTRPATTKVAAKGTSRTVSEYAAAKAPMPKNPLCPRDSWPVWPMRMFSEMPTMA